MFELLGVIKKCFGYWLCASGWHKWPVRGDIGKCGRCGEIVWKE